MTVVISSGLIEQIVALAAADPLREVCGLLLGEGDRIDNIVPAANIAPDPARTFEVDPVVQFNAIRHARAGGPAVIGCYHSHPSGNLAPSMTDCAMIGRAGDYWLITDGHDVRAWQCATITSFVEVRLLVQPSACAAS